MGEIARNEEDNIFLKGLDNLTHYSGFNFKQAGLPQEKSHARHVWFDSVTDHPAIHPEDDDDKALRTDESERLIFLCGHIWSHLDQDAGVNVFLCQKHF